MTKIEDVFERLLFALRDQAVKNGLLDEQVRIRCRPLSAKEAIGSPRDQDYPILKGKEALVEAMFKDAKGHAFTDEYGDNNLCLRDLVSGVPGNTRERAEFVACLNAVWRHLGLAEGTVHCKDEEPLDCARELVTRFDPEMRVLLVGFQPRMLELLSKRNPMRCLDLDAENIGQERFGVTIQGPDKTEEGIAWSQVILATGTTLVNGSLPRFIHRGRPVIFYGVTISAAAEILGFDRFCHKGH
jgi:hypothetical protein